MAASKFRACRAVLFDFDGVIADTMDANFRAWRSAFAELGAEIAPEMYYPLEGMSPAGVAQALGRLHGLDDQAAGRAATLKENAFLAGQACGVFPAVRPLLERLQAAGKIPGLVTGASKMRLDATLPDDIRAFFDVVITADAGTSDAPRRGGCFTGPRRSATMVLLSWRSNRRSTSAISSGCMTTMGAKPRPKSRRTGFRAIWRNSITSPRLTTAPITTPANHLGPMH